MVPSTLILKQTITVTISFMISRSFSDEQAQTLEGILDACKKAGKKFIMNAGDGYYACTFAFTAGVKIDGLEKDGITPEVC